VFSNNRVDRTEILYRANERVYITVIGGELGFAGTGCVQVAETGSKAIEGVEKHF
jgi:hypothetical protein